MSTTKSDRVSMVTNSTAYQSKIGRKPRHLAHAISEELYKASRGTAPKHRKPDYEPKHLRWAI